MQVSTSTVRAVCINDERFVNLDACHTCWEGAAAWLPPAQASSCHSVDLDELDYCSRIEGSQACHDQQFLRHL